MAKLASWVDSGGICLSHGHCNLDILSVAGEFGCGGVGVARVYLASGGLAEGSCPEKLFDLRSICTSPVV